MAGYHSIAWLPLCGGLTLIGLIASWFAWRRRGAAAGLRGVAWSLLPLVLYLIGLIELLWRFGAAIGSFAVSFVFSPQVWLGVIVAGLAVVLFAVSGLLRRRRARSGRGAKAAPGAGPAQAAGGHPPLARAPQPGKGKDVAGGDEFGDIQEILRRRGIR